MPINFPSSPANNQYYSYGDQAWYWANNYGLWQPSYSTNNMIGYTGSQGIPGEAAAIGYTGSAGTGGGGGATGGGSDQVFYENGANVTTDYTISTNKNALSAGPITINSGVTVTIPANSVWTIV